MLQIIPPRSDGTIKTLMKGINSPNSVNHNPNCTTSEFLQCNRYTETLKHKLIIDETKEKWSIIEKRNQVSRNCMLTN